MNNENQKIRDEFLSQACRYLFGQTANCNAFRQLGARPPASRSVSGSQRGHQH